MDLFPCYSKNLMNWLVNTKGIKYKLMGLHPQTKMQFYVFIEDEDFKKAIIEWKETKPSA